MPLFENRYRHEDCPVTPGIEWDDQHDCGCNDHCPACDAEVEPFESVYIVGSDGYVAAP